MASSSSSVWKKTEMGRSAAGNGVSLSSVVQIQQQKKQKKEKEEKEASSSSSLKHLTADVLSDLSKKLLNPPPPSSSTNVLDFIDHEDNSLPSSSTSTSTTSTVVEKRKRSRSRSKSPQKNKQRSRSRSREKKNDLCEVCGALNHSISKRPCIGNELKEQKRALDEITRHLDLTKMNRPLSEKTFSEYVRHAEIGRHSDRLRSERGLTDTIQWQRAADMDLHKLQKGQTEIWDALNRLRSVNRQIEEDYKQCEKKYEEMKTVCMMLTTVYSSVAGLGVMPEIPQNFASAVGQLLSRSLSNDETTQKFLCHINKTVSHNLDEMKKIKDEITEERNKPKKKSDVMVMDGVLPPLYLPPKIQLQTSPKIYNELAKRIIQTTGGGSTRTVFHLIIDSAVLFPKHIPIVKQIYLDLITKGTTDPIRGDENIAEKIIRTIEEDKHSIQTKAWKARMKMVSDIRKELEAIISVASLIRFKRGRGEPWLGVYVITQLASRYWKFQSMTQLTVESTYEKSPSVKLHNEELLSVFRRKNEEEVRSFAAKEVWPIYVPHLPLNRKLINGVEMVINTEPPKPPETRPILSLENKETILASKRLDFEEEEETPVITIPVTPIQPGTSTSSSILAPPQKPKRATLISVSDGKPPSSSK